MEKERREEITMSAAVKRIPVAVLAKRCQSGKPCPAHNEQVVTVLGLQRPHVPTIFPMPEEGVR